jgi:tRNA-2-methylthio-N6-dimethylallyladenosine synthase
MNAHDSERLAGVLDGLGYVKTDTAEDADLVVFNTCCVRESAENKIFGHLGFLKYLKEKKKDLIVAVCGCMTQRDEVIEKIKASYRWLDIVFGTFNLHRFAELLRERKETGGTVIDIWKEHDTEAEMRNSATRPHVPSACRDYRHKSGINIIYGCDNYCSYCIVPYVRGRERSRAAADILNEARGLAGDGVAELMLLGQNVNSYYSDGTDFAELLRLVCGVDGIERVRFMTSHPKDMSDKLISVMAENGKVCKSVHLPVQSGSTAVLRGMNRKYAKEDYLRLIEKLRTAIPEITVTTDIIVGFPGETEADFADTLDLVRRVRFSGAFTFLYSKRSGTAAAKMDNQVPADVANERFGRLLETVNGIVYDINRSREGQVLRVIPDVYDAAKGVVTGRSYCNAIVHFPADEGLAERYLGRLTDVRIIEGKPFYLLGESV